ncbi:predicted protein [Thalassiosira pseudonana CCMP1335]|uniref:Transmembrane protein n=1 Tax=Thalassiosira pseudonana TaxID=35128 RepID=B5YNQ5_THAPS|nr:predicted protein [Thalassiosira pseudonana CCMP1335]ACI64675.1 predicted protein [Thalassiosira pseudonana CCMP1335]
MRNSSLAGFWLPFAAVRLSSVVVVFVVGVIALLGAGVDGQKRVANANGKRLRRTLKAENGKSKAGKVAEAELSMSMSMMLPELEITLPTVTVVDAAVDTLLESSMSMSLPTVEGPMAKSRKEPL